MRSTARSGVLLVSLAGCGEDAKRNAEQHGQPDILVDPAAIDFGAVAVDGAVSAAPPGEVTEVVAISNEGDADLHIGGIELDDESGPYALGTITSVLVEPGGTARFAVTFRPVGAGPASATVTVGSDDPDEPEVEVDLLGTGIAAVIEVAPEEYDFGTLYLGCEAVEPIAISNAGNADLVVSEVGFAASSNDLVFDDATGENGALPWTIAPETSVEVYVAYAPLDEHEDRSWLSVATNDPRAPSLVATQEGTGAVFAENTDVFQQPLEGLSDIVFAVDRSSSMSDDIGSVMDNLAVFVRAMASLDTDFRVVATVEDDGCVNGSDPYIDNTFSASDAQAAITAMINLGGSYGENGERAFMLHEAFFGGTLPGGCNEGTLREGATLNLVGISDEPEQSVNNYIYYVSLFQSLKDDPDDVVFHGIGGDYPGGCATAAAYTGYYEAVVATGGVFLSICAPDWGSHLEALAEGSAADRSSFPLTSEPVAETVEVWVDGLETSVGWEYTASSNSIDFEPDCVPPGGSTIEVSYALHGDCEP